MLGNRLAIQDVVFILPGVCLVFGCALLWFTLFIIDICSIYSVHTKTIWISYQGWPIINLSHPIPPVNAFLFSWFTAEQLG